MTGWNTAKRRYRLVHHAAADVARTGQSGLTRWQPAIEAEYGNVGNFLRDIQRRYFTAALARLDSVIETDPGDPKAPVAAVFAEVAGVYPQLWQVLRDNAGHPALAEGNARFRHAVLAGTGVDPAAFLPGPDGSHQKARPTSSTIAQNAAEGHEIAFGMPKLSTCVLGDHVDPLKNVARPRNEISPQNLLDAHDIAIAPSLRGTGTPLNLDQVEPLKVRTRLLLSDAAQKLLAGHDMLTR